MRTHKEYQEALNKIVENSCPKRINCQSCEISSSCNSLMKDEIDILQELIDELTPKKVLNKRKSGAYVNVEVGECPKCGKFVTSIDKKPYQCDCRQELDWSDE